MISLAIFAAAAVLLAPSAEAGKWRDCKRESSGGKYQVAKISCVDGAEEVADQMWKSWNRKESKVKWSKDCEPWVPGDECKLTIGKKWACIGVNNPLRGDLVGWWNWKCEKKKGKEAVRGKYPLYDWLL